MTVFFTPPNSPTSNAATPWPELSLGHGMIVAGRFEGAEDGPFEGAEDGRGRGRTVVVVGIITGLRTNI